MDQIFFGQAFIAQVKEFLFYTGSKEGFSGNEEGDPAWKIIFLSEEDLGFLRRVRRLLRQQGML